MDQIAGEIQITFREVELLMDVFSKLTHIHDAVSIKKKAESLKERVTLDGYSEDTLISALCGHFGISKEDLIMSSRERRIVDIRAMVCKALHDHFPAVTLRRIGSYVGKDHSMVLHYFRMIDQIPQLNKEYQKIKKQLKIK